MSEDTPKYENMKMLSNGQFSCGDQTNESRIKFSKNDFKVCVKCDSTNIEKIENIAAYRFRSNGDAYGTDVFICKSCNWSTSFQWDEGGDSSYYYEIDYYLNFYKEKEESKK